MRGMDTSCSEAKRWFCNTACYVVVKFLEVFSDAAVVLLGLHGRQDVRNRALADSIETSLMLMYNKRLD